MVLTLANADADPSAEVKLTPAAPDVAKAMAAGGGNVQLTASDP